MEIEERGVDKNVKAKIDFLYPFLVWLLTIFTGATIVSLVEALQIKDSKIEAFAVLWAWIVIISGAFSIPSLVVSYLIYFVLVKMRYENTSLRLSFAIWSSILAIITAMLFVNYFSLFLTIPVYVCCIFIWSFL